jgi:hypothetical protein
MNIQQPPRATGYEAAVAMVDALLAAGIDATNDPRSANPPCVLVPPPISDLQQNMCGQWCSFDIYVLAPGPANADAFRQLEWLSYWVSETLPNVTGFYPSQYNLSADSPALPAYRIPIEVGV